MQEQHAAVKSWAITIALLVFAYSAVSYVRTYSNSIEPGTYRSFSVSGEGKVVAVPDVASFSFMVITEGGKDLSALQKSNTEKMNKIIAFIKSKGVDAKDIKTEGYNVSPRYTNYTCKPVQPMPLTPMGSSGSSVSMPAIYAEYDRSCPPPEITGYTITQSVSVKVRDFAKAGELLSGAVSNGANSVSQISFSIDDRSALENQAREEAMQKARAKAEAIAKAGNFRLGRLLSVDEGYGGPIYRTMEAFGKGGADMSQAVPAPSIEPGSQDIVINVNLRYEIK